MPESFEEGAWEDEEGEREGQEEGYYDEADLDGPIFSEAVLKKEGLAVEQLQARIHQKRWHASNVRNYRVGLYQGMVQSLKKLESRVQNQTTEELRERASCESGRLRNEQAELVESLDIELEEYTHQLGEERTTFLKNLTFSGEVFEENRGLLELIEDCQKGLSSLKDARRRSQKDNSKEAEELRQSEESRLQMCELENREKLVLVLRLWRNEKTLMYLTSRLRYLMDTTVSYDEEIAESKRLIEISSWKFTHFGDLYQEERGKRRDISNQIMDLRGNIRSFSWGSLVQGDLSTHPADGLIELEEAELTELDTSSSHRFELDYCYKPGSNPEGVVHYMDPFFHLVVKGYNVTIFSYGETDAKRQMGMLDPNENGTLCILLSNLFSYALNFKRISYIFKVSYVVICGDYVVDLNLLPESERLPSDLSQCHNKKYLSTVETMGNISFREIKYLPNFVAYHKKTLLRRLRAFPHSEVHLRSSHLIIRLKVESTDLDNYESLSSTATVIVMAGSELLDLSEEKPKIVCTPTSSPQKDIHLDPFDKDCEVPIEYDSPPEAAEPEVVLRLKGKQERPAREDLLFFERMLKQKRKKSRHLGLYNTPLLVFLQLLLDGSNKVLGLFHYIPDSIHLSRTLSTLRLAEWARTIHLGTAPRNFLKGSYMRSLMNSEIRESIIRSNLRISEILSERKAKSQQKNKASDDFEDTPVVFPPMEGFEPGGGMQDDEFSY